MKSLSEFIYSPVWPVWPNLETAIGALCTAGGGVGLAVNAANGYLKLLIVHTRYLVYIYHF